MTFSSVYQILTPLKTVRKQKFWDWFDGDNIRSWWSETVFGGGGTVSMADAVDEGLKIVSNTADQDGKQIDFNDIRHYSETASILIGVIRLLLTTSQDIMVAFRSVKTGTDITFTGCDTIFDNVKFILRTGDGTTTSFSSTAINLDTIFRNHKTECGSANIKYTLDGILEITKTTNRPTAKLQPVFFAQTRTTTAREGHIRYLEAYNT